MTDTTPDGAEETPPFNMAARINEIRTVPGDAGNYQVRRSELPPIPQELANWSSGNDPLPNLILTGPFKSGKTWLGINAAVELAAAMGTRPRVGYWSEGKLSDDISKRDWYEKVLQRDSNNNQLWSEYNTFDVEFVRLQYSDILVFDEHMYWDLPEWKRTHVTRFLRARLETPDMPLRTIICTRMVPDTKTLLGTTLVASSRLVQLPPLFSL